MLPVLGRLLHKPKGVLYAAWGGVEAVRYAIAHRFGSIDIDVHVSKDGILMAVHWPREWLLDGKPLGPIRNHTASELARAVPKNGGRWRIQPVATLLAEGRDRIVFCLEAKPDEALELASTWARVKADADRYGCRVVVMTIQRQGAHPIAWEAAAERRLRAAKTAGLPVMVLSRGWLDPARWGFVDAWKVNKRAELRWGKDMPKHIPYVGPGSPLGASAHPKTRIPVLAAPTPKPKPKPPSKPPLGGVMTATSTQHVVNRLRLRGVAVLTRPQWRSNHEAVYKARRASKPAKMPCSTVVQHITVTKDTGDFARDVRAVERIGFERFGSGVSYNWVVNMRTGAVAVGQPLDAKGTHTVNNKSTPGYSFDQNYAARAIAVLGMPGDKLSAKAAESIAQILAAMVAEGVVTRDFDYEPHSLFTAKDCPCDSTRDQMPAIKARAQAIIKEAAK